jgi:molybdopterin molybdotransferase
VAAVSNTEVSVAAAQAAIAGVLQVSLGTETVALAQALSRVLAADVISPLNVPAQDNSAMDGYALCGQDLLPGHDTLLLPLRGVVLAGAPSSQPVTPGRCLRIMTGAVLPRGADTVVPLERCTLGAAGLLIKAHTLHAGDNRRRAGEDLRAGQSALAAGQLLRPADIGLAASLGKASLVVFRRLRVALFSTGDELREPSDSEPGALPQGCIFDSNRHGLAAAITQLGAEVHDFGVVPDNADALRGVLARASQHDVIVTSGGVCLGDADTTRQVLADLGSVSFLQLAMRPGRNLAFGHIGSATLFALPGNPVAALVSFYVLVKPALRRLAGARPGTAPAPLALPFSARACIDHGINKRPGRSEFLRAVVSPSATGLDVRLTGPQGAGILRSMSQANALVVLGHEQGPVAAGQAVDVWLFDGLL